MKLSIALPAAIAARTAAIRPGRGWRLRRRQPDQRESLPAGQVRARGACALRRSITTGASACRPPPRRRSKRSASTAAFPFRWPIFPARETILLVGSNVAETMPPVMQYFEAQKKSGGSLIVVDPRATPTAGRGHAAPADHARHGCRARQRPAAHRDQRRLSRRSVYRGTHAGFRAGPAQSLRPTGRTAWSASPAFRNSNCMPRPRHAGEAPRPR